MVVAWKQRKLITPAVVAAQVAGRISRKHPAQTLAARRCIDGDRSDVGGVNWPSVDEDPSQVEFGDVHVVLNKSHECQDSATIADFKINLFRSIRK
ncbi:hypothetical protein B0H14DRAFT_3059840 [Mycena olivaceomarginata]|nr:hypothetical protein B0H14DRAFT_3059840 [Mycena olivaceomarginata]